MPFLIYTITYNTLSLKTFQSQNSRCSLDVPTTHSLDDVFIDSNNKNSISKSNKEVFEKVISAANKVLDYN